MKSKRSAAHLTTNSYENFVILNQMKYVMI